MLSLIRGYGKPVQSINTPERRNVSQLTIEELMEIAAGGSEGRGDAPDRDDEELLLN